MPEVFASSVASSTSVRSAGTMTIALSVSRGSTLTIDIPATTTPSTSRVSSSGSPLTSAPFDRAHDAAHGRCDEEPVLREGPDRTPVVHLRPGAPTIADRGHDLVEALGIGAVRDDREQCGPAMRELGERERRDLPHLSRRARNRRAELLRLALRGSAAEHEQHRSAEVGGDAGVVRELRRAADIRVVAADDHDRVALRLDGLVALARSWRARHPDRRARRRR